MKSVDGAGAFSCPLILLPFISSAFMPNESMPSVVRAFAENQPVTSIVEANRALLVVHDAIEYAKQNMGLNNVTNTQFIVGGVEVVIQRLYAEIISQMWWLIPQKGLR